MSTLAPSPNDFTLTAVPDGFFADLRAMLRDGRGDGSCGLHWPSTMRRLREMISHRPAALTLSDIELLDTATAGMRSTLFSGYDRARWNVVKRRVRAQISSMR